MAFKPKLTEQDFHSLAMQRGLRWLGEIAVKARDLTLWECPNGHQWKARYDNIRTGYGCPYCSGTIPKTDEDFHALAVNRNIIWTGNVPANSKDKTQWMCQAGHEWSANYDHVRRMNGCPICNGTPHYIKPRLEQYHALAKDRGMVFIGTVPANVKRKTRWICSCGNEWIASYDVVKGGSNCPACKPKKISSGRVKGRIPPEMYAQVAQRRGFEWIGEYPLNTETKTLWRCSRGHEWLAIYHNIRRGKGCPECDNRINGTTVSAPQIALAEMVEGEVNYEYNGYYLDVAIQVRGVPICLEFDGWYWHNSPEKIKEDQARDAYLISEGWHILRIRSGSMLPTTTELYAAIDRLVAGSTFEVITLPDWRD